ncbi:hypothetical protein NDU88_005577 [Pleurodeles waltl]|uniref:Uncharacterized protein n=1 Tax=Pleurodeles waltl TaxID=8319 RepID=A0AAV7SM14_PLEWA|nr:hypothetical protein NDU88_005577 [Pleurodeles waltl]
MGRKQSIFFTCSELVEGVFSQHRDRGRGRATKKDGRLIRELRVAANTGAAGALRWQENILCTATPAPTTVVPRPDAWRHREGDRGAKISRPAQAPFFPTERAWLEGLSRIKGEPHTVRPWNRAAGP